MELPGLSEDAKKYFLPCVLIVFVGISLFTIWKVEYLPFQDHPSHLLRVHILVNYDSEKYDFNQYFVPNWGLIANQGSDLLIFLLAHAFSPGTASKLFYSLYILLLPLAGLYFLKSFNPGNLSYVLVPVALTINQFVEAGNENFILSAPLFLIALTYWYNTIDSRSVRTKIVGALLVVFLYFCHILSFAVILLVALIIWWVERRNLKSFLNLCLVFLPAVIICLIWVLVKEPESWNISGFPSLALKMRSLAYGTSPVIFSCRARCLFSFFILFMVTTGVLLSKRMLRTGIFWGVFAIFLTAVLLPEWCIIFDPGKRLAFLALLVSTALLPNNQLLKYVFCFALIVLTLIFRIGEYKLIKSDSQYVSEAISPFKNLPPEVKQWGNKVLPLVLPPYTSFPPLHRSFEYYHIFNGGMNPYQLVSPSHTVRYRIKPAAPGVYKTSPGDLPISVLNSYDLVTIIGKDGSGGRDLQSYLSFQGFKEVAGNDFTGIFARYR